MRRDSFFQIDRITGVKGLILAEKDVHKELAHALSPEDTSNLLVYS